MALSIAQMVVRGEIDNTVEGETRGRVWLLGREDPLVLSLAGDCWRDLAGGCLSFTNPAPRETEANPSACQRGVVGDMTASRRVKVDGAWTNLLSLEWFSVDGRVVLESADFLLEMGERTWEMDADAEHAQKLANLQAMRDFLLGSLAVPEAGEEAGWDQRLRASERMADAYREVREKYRGEPDADHKEAFAMGWDGLLDALAYEAETQVVEEGKVEESCQMAETRPVHPFQLEAEQLAMRARDLVGSHCPPGSDGARLVGLLGEVAARLAGALSRAPEVETGIVLALLTQCTAAQSLGHVICTRLIDAEDDVDQERALEALRDEISMLKQELEALQDQLGSS